ncbi:MAG: O-succinylbenzoate synthase [Frankiales bacterium]|nr:O-succinylbenzoate synthase [Frankiales bacterium]
MPTLEVHVVALPMRVPFRGVTTREAILIRGSSGWGEFAPFVEYDDEESARWLAAALEAAEGTWPVALRDAVPVNATVPAVPAAQVAAVLARFPGCTTAKVKVAQAGQSLSDDVERVAAVRELVPNVRVDANGAWSVEEAVTALRALGSLEYAEQPCATVAELAAVRRRVDVPIAADESIRKASDPLLVARAAAADVVVLKVAPLGGVAAALRIAEECGLPVVVSSALDTSIGIRAGVALAAALPSLPFACGLATTSLMAGDVVTDSLDGSGGWIRVRDVTPSPDLLARYAAPPDREQWWRERLARVLELVA